VKEFLSRIRGASPAWLREQIVQSNNLIHETEQLLRGAGPEFKDLQSALWHEKTMRRLLQEELARRNGGDR
jgi:hypothetical protein